MSNAELSQRLDGVIDRAQRHLANEMRSGMEEMDPGRDIPVAAFLAYRELLRGQIPDPELTPAALGLMQVKATLDLRAEIEHTAERLGARLQAIEDAVLSKSSK